MSGLGDKMKPPGAAVHGDTNEGPTFGTIIMETVSFLSGRSPNGFCTNTSSMTGLAVPHRSVSHAGGGVYPAQLHKLQPSPHSFLTAPPESSEPWLPRRGPSS